MRSIALLFLVGLGTLSGCSSSTQGDTALSCKGCNVTGTWYGDYSVSSTANVFQVSIVQSGDTLSGTMRSFLFGSSTPAITGTQKDGKIEFGDIDAQIHFSGTTDGKQAKGTYDYPSEAYSGTWEADLIKSGTITKTNCINVATTGSSPGALTYDGTAFWYMSLGDGVIRRIDSSGNILKSFDRPGNIFGGDPKFAFDGTNLWMSDISSLTVMGTDGSPKSNVEITFDTDEQPINGITAMNGAIWTTAPDSRLRRIDAQAKTLEAKTLLINSAGAAVFDGQTLWVAEGFTGNNNVTHLYQVNASNRVTAVYTLSETVSAGSFLLMADLAYDGSNLWGSFESTDEICMVQLTTD